LKANELIEDYRRLLELTNAERVPYPNERAVHSSQHLIRHAVDVLVLLSALASYPTGYSLTTRSTSQKPSHGVPDCGSQRQRTSSG
jgi:hypothetical protein